MSTADYNTCVTRAGDTFDLLAIAAYNDEKLASRIIQENPRYANTIVFEAGVEIKMPVISSTETPSTLPPWRR